jgi:cold shock protein
VIWALTRFPEAVLCKKTGFPFLIASTRRAVESRTLKVLKGSTYMSNASTGTVKWFNETKGFGFITPEGGGEDLFAHFKEIQGTGFRTLKEGQRVEFTAKRGPKGMQATAIKPL